MTAFKIEDSIQFDGYRVNFTPAMWNFLDGVMIDSSWNIFYARLFSLPYPEFLRMVRDFYGATLYGKTGYVCFYFKERGSAQRFINDANKRFELWRKI